MQNHRNLYRTGNHLPGVQIVLRGQVAIALENPIKHGEASVAVSGYDDAWCDPMRERRPGRAKGCINCDERKQRSARKRKFTNVAGFLGVV